jgi:hypothetical protein
MDENVLNTSIIGIQKPKQADAYRTKAVKQGLVLFNGEVDSG